MNKFFVTAAIMMVAGMVFFSSCDYDQLEETPGNYTVKVNIQLKEGSSNFALNTDYLNAFNETYRVNKWLFYISNIEMLRNNNTANAKETESYHLVDASNPASLNFSFNVPYKNTNSIRFLVGVDSLRNVSGAQTGALDPANGMFWTWSSGYIMAKLEGSSPQSTQPGNLIIHHIGGFSGDRNATRWITLNFPAGTSMNVAENGTCEVVVEADIHKWFNGVHDVKIADFAYTMSPGGTAMKLADNYASMFTVTSITNH